MNQIFKTYKYIWLCGLAASGKTSALKFLSKKFAGDITFFNDSKEVVEFISKDTELKHHRKPTPDSFIVTDSEAFMYSIRSLSEKVRNESHAIIELSRGYDKTGLVDLSYKAFNSVLPQYIQRESLCIYIETAKEIRFKRNEQRPKLETKNNTIEPFTSFYCPEDAMKQLFSEDDFFQNLSTFSFDVIVIHNNGSKEDFDKKMEYLFH